MSLRLQPVGLNTKGWQATVLSTDKADAGDVDSALALETPIEALTDSVGDKGVFDVLMRQVKKHLTEEYENQRITGKEYATVYLGSLTAVLQTSTQFLMNQQQVYQINAQIGLIRQQTVTELANTDDSIPEGLGFNFIPKEKAPVLPVDYKEGS